MNCRLPNGDCRMYRARHVLRLLRRRVRFSADVVIGDYLLKVERGMWRAKP